jgi:hypothetical protein
MRSKGQHVDEETRKPSKNENIIRACCLLGEGQMFLRLATALGYVY